MDIVDNLIPKFYKEYGEYTNSSRAFPLFDDGLKPSERRILLTAYEICKDHFVKSAKLEGTTMAAYHPHASAYKTIVQLVNQGFLDGQGKFGSSIGSDSCEAAASRYTEIKLNKDIKDLAFNLINYVERVESE